MRPGRSNARHGTTRDRPEVGDRGADSLAHLAANPGIRGGEIGGVRVAQIAQHVAAACRDLVEHGRVLEGADGAVAEGCGPIDASGRHATVIAAGLLHSGSPISLSDLRSRVLASSVLDDAEVPTLRMSL
jgi:hypothetical protein